MTDELPIMPFIEIPDEFIYDNGKFIKIRIVTEEEKEKWVPYNGFIIIATELIHNIICTIESPERDNHFDRFDRFITMLSLGNTCRGERMRMQKSFNRVYLTSIFLEMFTFGNLHINEKFTCKFVRISFLNGMFHVIIRDILMDSNINYLSLLLSIGDKSRDMCLRSNIDKIKSSSKFLSRHAEREHKNTRLQYIELYLAVINVIFYNDDITLVLPEYATTHAFYKELYVYHNRHFNDTSVPICIKSTEGHLVDISKMWPMYLKNGYPDMEIYCIHNTSKQIQDKYTSCSGKPLNIQQEIINSIAREIYNHNNAKTIWHSTFEIFNTFIREKTNEYIRIERENEIEKIMAGEFREDKKKKRKRGGMCVL